MRKPSLHRGVQLPKRERNGKSPVSRAGSKKEEVNCTFTMHAKRRECKRERSPPPKENGVQRGKGRNAPRGVAPGARAEGPVKTGPISDIQDKHNLNKGSGGKEISGKDVRGDFWGITSRTEGGASFKRQRGRSEGRTLAKNRSMWNWKSRGVSPAP